MRRQKSGMNVFMIAGVTTVSISIAIALAVFGFEFYLKGAQETKTTQLMEAQRAVNIDTVEDFIRLRNRLGSVETLLDNHVELSEFFTVLETRTLQTVRFSGLAVAVAEDRSAEIEMSGTARTFNALAAQSTQFAAEKRIKRAIFSDISVNGNGTVDFSLTAILDPRLITSSEILPGISESGAPIQSAPGAAPNIVLPTMPTTSPATSTRATSSPVL